MDESGSPMERSNDIAIVGMAARFPGAPDVETFWRNVRDGVESIVPLDDEALTAAGVSQAEINDPDYVKVCPLLNDVDKFDAGFFGFNPREASVMDPAHRIFLEIAWAAFENAGYSALPDESRVGVFATAGAPDYYVENVKTNPDIMRSMGDFLVRHTGNDMNFLATRVSYEMDLRGPSMNIQTACSSALVALHQAAQSLRQNECDMALIGGATILFPQGQGYMYRDGEILSPDGHCRPFDAKSAGTVFGSGAGALIVKRLDDALDDGDTIHAVMKGSAVNNDGALKVGYLAPGVDGQASVIADALDAAQVPGESVTYIETHGTGTLVGDPIEVEALKEVYGSHSSQPGHFGIGSVKSNIGHLGETAAAASLIKAIMALKHRQLPPSLGFESPNPAMDLENSAFYVNDRLKDWTSDGPLRCAVTALGAGGTNCHVILEEAPAPLPGEGEREQQLFALSANTAAALNDASSNLADALETDTSVNLADAAYTLAVGRRAMTHRRIVVAANRTEAIERLRDEKHKLTATLEADQSQPKTVFMFPGGGAQYAGMGQDLYQSEDVYRDAVDECLSIITPKLGRDLKPLMFPEVKDVESATRTLEQPSLTLPSLFTTSYALSCLYESWGLQADAYIGHSMGEYVAACKAGIFTLEDAISLVMLRGDLFERIDRGGMLSVPLSEADVRKLAPKTLDIAAVNAPDLCVASGPSDQITAFQETLTKQDIESTAIRIDVAAHSRMLDPILDRFREACRKINFKPPQKPLVSNLTGTWVTPEQATDPDYWVDHLRSTVRFADGLKTLRALGEPVLVEMGPGRTLSMLAKAQEKPFRGAFNTVRHPQESASDTEYALAGLGKIWASGAELDWGEFYGTQLRNRIPLPSYPFARDTFWVAPGQLADAASSQELVKRDDIKDWFAQISYREAPRVRSAKADIPRKWMIFAQTPALANQVKTALGQDEVVTVSPGRALTARTDHDWELNFDEPDQFVDLLEQVENRTGAPDHIIIITQGSRLKPGTHDANEGRLFLQPTYVLQALAGLTDSVQVSVLTSGLSDLGGQRVDPYQALALGPVLTAPREFSHVSTRCIDLPAPAWNNRWGSKVSAELADELRGETDDDVVILRQSGRWVRDIVPTPIEALADGDTFDATWLHEDGVYLLSGGLGGIGLEMAQLFASLKPVKLALLSRKGLPPEHAWEGILSSPTDSRMAQSIRAVQTLRDAGAQVAIVVGDVTDARSLSQAIAETRAQLGPINGLIHSAGMMDDAPIMTKDANAMKRILAPKVLGTVNLDRLITEDLDFFVTFSSVASFLGLPGQVDYTAANAFLDAFARARSKRASGRSLVINWNAWRDVGMAASLYSTQNGEAPPQIPSRAAIWDGFTDIGANRLYQRDFRVAEDWVLNEHVVKDGHALLSGTTMLELARAAAAELLPGQTIGLSNLTFLAPFVVASDEPRRLCLMATRNGDESFELAFYAGSNLEAAPLVVCDAAVLASDPSPDLDLQALRTRLDQGEWISGDGFLEQNFMAFGPRWANMKSVTFGTDEALVELELDHRFLDDLGPFGLHPALLDMATGGVQKLIPGADLNAEFYVPLSYDSVRVFDDTPEHIFSHVICLPGSEHGLAYFDVTLTDPSGRVIAEISRFTMKRLGPDEGFAFEPSVSQDFGAQSLDDLLIKQAIPPSDGLDAFRRVMAQDTLVQSIISSVDPALWQRQLQADQNPGDTQDTASKFQRPELAADYEAPESAIEADLAGIWSELLGVKTVGTKDDFFDLGGNSLIGVRLFASIRKKYGLSFPLSTLFETPTISELASLMADRGVSDDPMDTERAPSPAGRSDWSPLVKLKAGQPGLREIFVIHGARGNILKFKALADRLADTRPIYGIQAFGTDGQQEPLDDISEMARRYIDCIKTVQPRGPYTLAGYSGGGIIAYEMAQQLKQANESTDMIVMFDTIHPRAIDTPIGLVKKLQNIPRLHPSLLSDGIRRRLRRIPILGSLIGDDEDQIHEDSELEAASWRIWDAFHLAQENYHPQPYDGTLAIVRAKRATLQFLDLGASLGWEDHLSTPFIGLDVDATHNSLFDEPAVIELAEKTRKMLAEFAGKPGR